MMRLSISEIGWRLRNRTSACGAATILNGKGHFPTFTLGDILEAVAEENKITLRPKSVIDRELARALEDVKKGRVVGPFSSAAELLADLHKRVARQAKRRPRAKTA